jgi:hypothetical protein
MDTKYLPQRGMRRGGPLAALSAALLVAALTSAAAPAGPADGEPKAPPAAGGAGTQPAESGISVTISGAPAAATTAAKVRSIADRLTITDMDRTVLDAVRDDTKQIDETGLYVGLGIAARAAGNVQLDPQEWSQLDRPAYVSLLAEPKLWRARPLQATASIFRVTKLMSGEGLNYSDFWPKERTVWRMDGVLPGNNDQPDPERPIIILSVVNPAEFLGLGEPGTDKAEMEYKRGPQIRVAAIFYKDLIDNERNDTDRNGAVRAYPVIMAWQLGRTDMSFAVSGGKGDGLLTRLAPAAILLIVLVGGFYLLRRRMTPKRQDGGVQGPRYQPLRGAGTTAGSPRDAAVNPEDVYVDPELAAAVEQYRHEKGLDETEGTTGAAGKNRHG